MERDEEAVSCSYPKEQDSSFISRVFFIWLNPYVLTGFRRRLEVTDQLVPPPLVDQEELYRKFKPMWAAECKKPPQKRSLARTLSRIYRSLWLVSFLWCCVSYGLLLLGPLITRRLIIFLQASHAATTHTHASPPPLSHGLVLVAILFCVNILDACIKSYSMYHIKMVGVGLRALIVTAIFRKGLALAPQAQRDTPIARLVNQVSSEASWLLTVFPSLMNLACAPIIVVAITVIIFLMLGPCIIAGLVVMLCYLPVMRCVGRRQKMASAEKQHAADERIKVANEAIQGAKVIKLYAWADAVAERIRQKRVREARFLMRFSVLRAASVALTAMIPLLALLVTFVSYYLLNGRSPDLQDLYTVIALFKLLMLPFKTFAEGITSLASLQVALARFQRFLELPEAPHDHPTHPLWPSLAENNDVGLRVRGEFAWDASRPKPSLRGLDIQVRRGELVAVVGAVGSGKSSVISAAIGEIEAVGANSGREVHGSVALVAQQPFIMNTTLRENVVFGTPLSPVRYQRAVEASALLPDLEVLPHRDDTEIGSRGINLSGGQRARISLARACYSSAEVILLDDPLSAVDAHVAKHLWDELIVREWSDKCVLLTTNQIAFLKEPRVSRIVVLEHGEVVQEGSFEELMAAADGGPFARLAASLDLRASEHRDREERHDQDGDREGGGRGLGSDVRSSSLVALSNGSTSQAQTNEKGGSAGRLTSPEARHAGAVEWGTYMTYFRAFRCLPYVAVMLALFLVVEGIVAVQDWFLGQWASGGLGLHTQTYMKVYAVAVAVIASLILTRGVMFACFAVKAASAMQSRAMVRVLGSPMTFFDTTPLGRILNRFSQDVNVLDVDLPSSFEMLSITWSRVLSVVVVACVPQPLFAVGMAPVLLLFYFIKELYRRSARECQRLYAVTWSPVLGCLDQTLTGLMTVRAYGAERHMDEQFTAVSRVNAAFAFAKMALDQWIFTQLSFLCALVMSGSALGVILTRFQTSPALAGLAFASTLTLIVELRFGVRYATDVEAQLNSVDRLDEYSRLAQEAPARVAPDDKLPSDWPKTGSIRFCGLSLRYRPGLPLVLRGLEAYVEGGKKVGIVGRTGSGKSSLLLALFRIIEPDQGTIELHGVDIRSLGLDRLRRALAIVPQDPVMFSGSVRDNLDPFAEYGDDEVWWALDRCGMSEAIKRLPGSLEAVVTEQGSNFSVGERQLLCMGRALLRRAKVLVLDEATASVDPTTDLLIQRTIRESFHGCTVVAVAHRIRTILDYDQILVLDQGVLVECGSPQELLERGAECSVFASMAKHSGLGVGIRGAL